MSSGLFIVRGNALAGSVMNYTYALEARDGRVVLVRQPGSTDTFDTMGISKGDLKSALENGINDAVADHDFRATEALTGFRTFTISLEPAS